MTRNDLMSLIGFILFFLGMLSIVLSLVGIHFTFLSFLETWGGLVAFLIKVLLVIVGFVLIYLSKTQYPRKEKNDN